MNVSPVSTGAASNTPSPPTPLFLSGERGKDEGAPAADSGIGGFARIVTQFLNDAGAQQAHAEQAVSNLAAGRAGNVHNVMLSMAKADLSFHLVLEIRNRLSDAYQEIMRMQV